jgi:hypothetical protein
MSEQYVLAVLAIWYWLGLDLFYFSNYKEVGKMLEDYFLLYG